MKNINLYFDASITKNPGGHIGLGCYIEIDNEVRELCAFVAAKEVHTVNVAEHMALIYGLDYLVKQDLHRQKVNVFGDSQLVIKQMLYIWGAKSYKAYYEYYEKSILFRKKFTNINFVWIPREENTEADRLSGKILEEYNLIKKRR